MPQYNEILRRNGFLSTKAGSKSAFLTLKEKFKHLAVDIAQRSGMRPAAQTILRMFPKIKNMYTKPSIIDFNKTLAHCTDLSGMKAYSYGGIKIYNDKFTSWDFGELLEEVEVLYGDKYISSYMALIDTGDYVSLKPIVDRDEAQDLTKFGLRRLFMPSLP